MRIQITQVLPLSVEREGAAAPLVLDTPPRLAELGATAEDVDYAWLGPSSACVALTDMLDGSAETGGLDSPQIVPISAEAFGEVLGRRSFELDGRVWRIVADRRAVAAGMAGKPCIVLATDGPRVRLLRFVSERGERTSHAPAIDELYVRRSDLASFVSRPLVPGVQGAPYMVPLTERLIRDLRDLGSIRLAREDRDLLIVVASDAPQIDQSFSRVAVIWDPTSEQTDEGYADPADLADAARSALTGVADRARERMARPFPENGAPRLALAFAASWEAAWSVRDGQVQTEPARLEAAVAETTGRAGFRRPEPGTGHGAPPSDLVIPLEPTRLSAGIQVEATERRRELADRLAASSAVGASAVPARLIVKHRADRSRLCALVANPYARTPFTARFIRKNAYVFDRALLDAALRPALGALVASPLAVESAPLDEAAIAALEPLLSRMGRSAACLFDEANFDAAARVVAVLDDPSAARFYGDPGGAPHPRDVAMARIWTARRLLEIANPILARIVRDLVVTQASDAGFIMESLYAAVTPEVLAGTADASTASRGDLRRAWRPLIEAAADHEGDHGRWWSRLDEVRVLQSDDLGFFDSLRRVVARGGHAAAPPPGLHLLLDHVERARDHYAFALFQSEPAAERRAIIDDALAVVGAKAPRAAFGSEAAGQVGGYLAVPLVEARSPAVRSLAERLRAGFDAGVEERDVALGLAAEPRKPARSRVAEPEADDPYEVVEPRRGRERRFR